LSSLLLTINVENRACARRGFIKVADLKWKGSDNNLKVYNSENVQYIMAEQTVMTHRTTSPFKQGPTVRDMYDIVKCLKDYSKDILVTDVCVLGTAGMLSSEPSFRYFRNEMQVSSHYTNDDQQYAPADKKTIEHILAKSKEAAEMAKQDVPVNLAGLEFLRQRENNGSYICFEDMTGSIGGKVEYVGSDGKIATGVLELIAGMVFSAPFVLGGIYKTGEAFRTATPTTAPYYLFGLGALIFAALSVDGMHRIIRSAFSKHLKTTIWPSINSADANRKVLSLAEVVRKEY
jgi:hypothetical protein